MSIHARLSPEAQQNLAQQRRSSLITSFIIALLTIILLLLILFLYLLPAIRLAPPTVIVYSSGSQEEDPIEQKRITREVTPKPNAPSSALAKVIAAQTISPTSVPVPDVTVTPSTEFGLHDDIGQGWGTGGEGGGGGWGKIPATMRKRCSEMDRLKRLAQNGGTKECEVAVVKALRWFKQTQRGDGSWGSSNQVAVTGLVLLAYLGHCETPLSEEFGDTVTKAIVYLINNGDRQKGRLGTNLGDRHWVYEHGIACYALSEAYMFCSQLGLPIPKLEETVQNTVQWIINNQNKSGGWEYGFDEAGGRGGDMSITAWQLQALKAGHHTNLEFNGLREAVNKALKYCGTCQRNDGGFGYAGTSPVGGSHCTLTGAGTLCFQQHRGTRNRSAKKGMDYIDKNSRFNYKGGPCNLYEHYYSSQAAINQGGNSWTNYNKLFRDQLLGAQAGDGHFPNPAGGGPGSRNDPAYNTALATLMLEVYYRFLPGTGLGL